ncbi:MAG TPA: glutamate cyclase domain-containing protein [Gemmataceae bacterium]|nr:glutamate cyclase domain-containing protein [Gemmataceae bacterium]
MNSEDILRALRDAVQVDVGNRGLGRDPKDNLFTACPSDFAAACRSIAEHPAPRVGIVTGFMIPSVDPPTGETDGPLGALFLARALTRAGIPCVLASDAAGFDALTEGVRLLELERGARSASEGETTSLAGASGSAAVVKLPDGTSVEDADQYRAVFGKLTGSLTHLIAVERVGPNHRVSSLKALPTTTPEVLGQFVKAVPRPQRGRCFTMRGHDLTPLTAPAHHLFEGPRDYVTIGIGDGGNEIGMGKVPWDTIRKNIKNGELIACRVATDHLIVAGISNWGAYALAAGVLHLRGKWDASLVDLGRERALLEHLVVRGPLVDGVTGKRNATVDGLGFEGYAKPLQGIAHILASGAP